MNVKCVEPNLSLCVSLSFSLLLFFFLLLLLTKFSSRAAGEKGMLSFVLDPDFANNGKTCDAFSFDCIHF